MRRRKHIIERQTPVTQDREEAERASRVALIAGLVANFPAADAVEEDNEGVEANQDADGEEDPGGKKPGGAEAEGVGGGFGPDVRLREEAAGGETHRDYYVAPVYMAFRHVSRRGREGRCL